MVNTTIYSAGQSFEDFINNDVPNLFDLSDLTTIKDFFSSLDNSTLTPTAVGSTLIAFTDANGFSVEMQGTGFGPITSISDLTQAFNDFTSAVAALDGSATANVSRLQLSDAGGAVLTIDFSATSWTITSGVDVLTINGTLPTSLSEIEAAVNELVLDVPGPDQLNHAYDPATSVLSGYDITSITAASNGVIKSTIVLNGTSATITTGDYQAIITGVLPDNFAQVAHLAVLKDMQAASSPYSFTSGTINNTATSQVVAEMNGGPLDFMNFKGWASNGDDTFTSHMTKPYEFEMGQGNDTVTTVDMGGSDVFFFEAGEGHDTVSLGDGDDDWINLQGGPSAWQMGQDVAFSFDGNDIIATFNASDSVRMVDQLITGNIEAIGYEWNGAWQNRVITTSLVKQSGTSAPDSMTISSGAGQFYDALGGNDMVFGSGQSDILLGGSGDDELNAEMGNDAVDGGEGNDLIRGGEGKDFLVGGAGSDIVAYNFSPDAVTVNLTVQSATGGYATGDTISGFENVIGSAHDDILIGSNAANMLRGNSGSDNLSGFGGNDSLFGEFGNDIISGGDGADFLDGGAGMDLLRYYSSTGGVIIDLQAMTASGGYATGDTISGFENLWGSNGFNDTLLGDDMNNGIRGFGGTDVIRGRGGADGIFGDSGGDWLYGDAGADTLNGGSDMDRLFGGDDNDVVNGDAGADILHGNSGDDTINGGTGSDRLYGETGDDTMNGGDQNDSMFGHAGNDTLNGDSGNDVLWGYSGNDNLNGGIGNDFAYGGMGADIINGGDGDDVLNGNFHADKLYGDAGSDTLNGGAGFDALFGGDDADTLHGGAAIDVLWGGNGADSLYGDTGNDKLYGGAQKDILNGGAGTDWLQGGGDTDTFVFTNGFGSKNILFDFASTNAEKIDLSGVTGITDFDDLVANHLFTDAGTGYAMIVDGADSFILENYHESDFGVGQPISDADFIF